MWCNGREYLPFIFREALYHSKYGIELNLNYSLNCKETTRNSGEEVKLILGTKFKQESF